MNNRYGWICPQCGRVWAPFIETCGPCDMEATRSSYPKDTEDCSCYHDGECWGTKEREATNCQGNKNYCDKYESEWR